jgi:hypothetical protein
MEGHTSGRLRDEAKTKHAKTGEICAPEGENRTGPVLITLDSVVVVPCSYFVVQ